MGRAQLRVATPLLLLFILVSVQAESIVESDTRITISEEPIFLNALDSNYEESLAVGDDGVVFAIPNSNPEESQKLESITDQDLNAVDFHPAGNAFIVGDSGRILRYDFQDKRLSNVSGIGLVEISTLTAVAWNTTGMGIYLCRFRKNLAIPFVG